MQASVVLQSGARSSWKSDEAFHTHSNQRFLDNGCTTATKPESMMQEGRDANPCSSQYEFASRWLTHDSKPHNYPFAR